MYRNRTISLEARVYYDRLNVLLITVPTERMYENIITIRINDELKFNSIGREPPTIELYPSARQSVTLGSNVLIQCRITGGIPTPSIKWTRRNGESLPSQVEEITPGVLK